jgi:hypothetical protein
MAGSVVSNGLKGGADSGTCVGAADGWDDLQVHAFEEGELPRRLWRVTSRRSA